MRTAGLTSAGSRHKATVEHSPWLQELQAVPGAGPRPANAANKASQTERLKCKSSGRSGTWPHNGTVQSQRPQKTREGHMLPSTKAVTTAPQPLLATWSRAVHCWAWCEARSSRGYAGL